MNDNERTNLTEPAAPEETMDAVRGILRAPENPEDWSWRKNFPEQPEAQRELVRIDAKQSVGEPLRLVNKRILLEDSVRIATKVECIHCTIEIFKSGAVDIGEDGALWLKHCDVRGGKESSGERRSLADALARHSTEAKPKERRANTRSPIMGALMDAADLGVLNNLSSVSPILGGIMRMGEQMEDVLEGMRQSSSRSRESLPQYVVSVFGKLHIYDTTVRDLTVSDELQGHHEGWMVQNSGTIRMVDTNFVHCKGNIINDADAQEQKHWFDTSIYAYRVQTKDFVGNFLTGCEKTKEPRITLESCVFTFMPHWDTDTQEIEMEPFVKLYRSKLYNCVFQMSYGAELEVKQLMKMTQAAFSATEGAPCIMLAGCLIEASQFGYCTKIDLYASALRSCEFGGCTQVYTRTQGRLTEFLACKFAYCGWGSDIFFQAAKEGSEADDDDDDNNKWDDPQIHVKDCHFESCSASENLLSIEVDPYELSDDVEDDIVVRNNSFCNCSAGQAIIYIGDGDEPDEDDEYDLSIEDNDFVDCDCADNVSGLIME